MPNEEGETHGDFAKTSEIDFDVVAAETHAAAMKFFAEYNDLLGGKEFGPFEGPRRMAMSLGLMRVVHETVNAGPDEIVFPWAKNVNPDDDRSAWTDVCKVIDFDTFNQQFATCFNTLATYAALDDDGWHAPGNMGWFACSDDTPESFVAFKREFTQCFIKAAQPDDTLVVVDCHI